MFTDHIITGYEETKYVGSENE